MNAAARVALVSIVAIVAGLALWMPRANVVPSGRREVVFWHFWGGRERPVVERIVREFNESQNVHYVRAVAMPGSNLDVKFFLSVAAGDPPDVINHDDAVVADWASRGAILPIRAVAGRAQSQALRQWLSPPARAISTHDGELYAVPNGLDIRALYCDARVLREFGLKPPRTIAELDTAARRIAPPGQGDAIDRYGFLPDPRRIWAWGVVFGGRFYDERTRTITLDEPRVVEALEWMASYSRRYGARRVLRFRNADQALPGAAFPLYQGRYAMVMDGQWRLAEMRAAQSARAGQPPLETEVVPLPAPRGGRTNAGWANGNRFVVPRGAANPEGAWEFMQFWSGFGGNERRAARACAAGGWLPVSASVARQAEFQRLLAQQPQLATFVQLAASEHQIPTPSIPGGQLLYDEVVRAAEDAMYGGVPPRAALQAAASRFHRARAGMQP